MKNRKDNYLVQKSYAGILTILLKVGPKLLTLATKTAKGLKMGKVGLAGASMASYSYILSWEFAAVLMAMLFVHESGHIFEMKRYGMKTKGIYFIPLLGGAAVADEDFPSRRAESDIAIMGPLWGLALCIVFVLIFCFTENEFFAVAASWMAMINLFNLLPINPLDGGRIFKSIAFSVHSGLGLIFLSLGLMASIYITFKIGLGLFALIFFVGMLDFFWEKNDIKRKQKKVDDLKVALDMAKNIAIEESGVNIRLLHKTEYALAKAEEELAQLLAHRKAMSLAEIMLAITYFAIIGGLLWGIMILMPGGHSPAAFLS